MLEFRAGKMDLQENQLVADSRKGKIRLSKDADGLVHFQWITEAGYAEESFVLLPNQATFTKIGPEEHRTYALKYKDKTRTLFFWMQEMDAAKDVSLCEQVNQLLAYQQASELGEGSQGPTPDPTNLAQMLSGMFASPGGTSLDKQAKLAAALLSSAYGKPINQIFEKPKGPSLAEVLKPETLMKYLEQPEMLESLAEYLPESQRSQEDMIHQCLSPQFSQQMNIFSLALQTGKFDPAALGLSMSGTGAIEFLDAIQKLVDQERSSQKPNS